MKRTFRLYWAPDAHTISVVEASSAAEARKKAPKPYKKFLGEVGVEELTSPQFETVRGYRYRVSP